MGWQLKLSRDQHKEIWKRKETVEKRFGVRIFSPYYEGKSRILSVSTSTVLKQEDLYCILVEGYKSNFEELKKYVAEAFIDPHVSPFFYGKDLKPILGSKLWIEVLEELYSVCISLEQQSLNISGTSSSVQRAISALTELMTKYRECVEKFPLDDKLESVKELVLALRVCKNLEVDVHTFKPFPKEVITILISWLKQVYKENFPLHDAASVSLDNLDNSIVIVDVPEEKPSIPIIVLDSDSEYELSAEDPVENFPPQTTSKRKKQKKQKNSKKKKLSLQDHEKESVSLTAR